MSSELVTRIDDDREWLPQADVMQAIGCGRTYLWSLRDQDRLRKGDDWRTDHRGQVFYRRDALNDLLADTQGCR